MYRILIELSAYGLGFTSGFRKGCCRGSAESLEGLLERFLWASAKIRGYGAW